MEHHPDLPPSSFPAKNLCPSFSSAPAGDAAERGSDLHALFEQKINNGDVKEFNDFTEFEIAGLDWAVDIVNLNVDATKPILTEQKVSYGEHYFGTADVINENKLFDLKTGEERSYYMQMCAYAGIDASERTRPCRQTCRKEGWRGLVPYTLCCRLP